MDALQMLKDRVERDGPSKVARELGVHRVHIWGVLNGKWGIGDKLLKAMGLERRERIVRQKAVSE